MAKGQSKVKTADLQRALRDRYRQPEWALFFEVSGKTGGAGRRADAVAMNMYPSRGLELHGFEIKCSRADWLRELKTPAKAEDVSAYCDRWWVVAAAGIVKDDELPPTWGLIELSSPTGNLRQKVAAPALEAQAPDRAFIASMLRASVKRDEAEIDAKVVQEVAKEREALRALDNQMVSYAESETERLRREIDAFEEATGLAIRGGMRGRISPQAAEAVNLVMKLGVTGTFGLVSRLRSAAEQVVAATSDVETGHGGAGEVHQRV